MMATNITSSQSPAMTHTTTSAQKADDSSILFWALNGYGITVFALLISIVLLIMAFGTIVLNSVVVKAIYCRGEYRVPSDNLIFGLAMADTLAGIIQLYYVTYNLTNYQIFEECLFRNGLMNTAFAASAFHLMILTCERYVKIKFPFSYHTVFKRRTTVFLSLGMWLLAFIFGMAPAFGWNAGRPTTGLQCTFFGIQARSYKITILIVFYIPFLAMTVMYTHIYRIARKHALAIAKYQQFRHTIQLQTVSSTVSGTTPTLRSGSNASSSSVIWPTTSNRAPSKQAWRLTKTISIIIGFYILCWLPVGIFISIELDHHLDDYSLTDLGTILMYLAIFPFLNAFINPIIYAVKIPYIRSQFKWFCSCVVCWKR